MSNLEVVITQEEAAALSEFNNLGRLLLETIAEGACDIPRLLELFQSNWDSNRRLISPQPDRKKLEASLNLLTQVNLLELRGNSYLATSRGSAVFISEMAFDVVE